MTSTTSRSGATGLPFLDELIASEELWPGRNEAAEAIAQHLLRTSSPIVVLHGPRRSGKTELIRRRVVPLVSPYRRVRFHDSVETAEAPAPGGDGTIEFWDSFESSLTEDDSARGDVVRYLSHALDGQGGCRLALVVSDDALNRLLKLCSEIPQVIEDIYELPRVETRSLLDRIQGLTNQCGVSIAESFFTALTRDLTADSTATTAELAAILVFEMCRVKPPGNVATDKYYDSCGRLAGILEAHLNWLLERLPDALDPQIGWAVLEELVAIGGSTGQSPDLAEIANRFEVPTDIPDQVLAWLEHARRVVQRRPNGDYALAPASLVLAVRSKQQRDAMADEHHRWLLRQAVRTVADAEDLVSSQVFRRIHARRSAIKISQEETAILLRCALVYEDAGLEGATRYWLRRTIQPDVQVDTLLEALFDTRASVRGRAAHYLRTFSRSDVRNQLHLLALRDPEDAVRAQAVESLAANKDEDLQASLIKEIGEPGSPYRLQAIDALRIFDTGAATEALVRIVQTNAVGEDMRARERAIEVLGRRQSVRAADALLEVAMRDRDAEDRERAALALGSIDSNPVLQFVLDRLHELARQAKRWDISWSWRAIGSSLLNAVLALAALGVSAFVHGFVLMTMRRWRLGIALSAVGGAAFALGVATTYEDVGLATFFASMLAGQLIPFRLLVLERQTGLPMSRYRRCLSVATFVSCLPVFVYFHGLACMVTKRFRRGLVLMTFEALGILLLVGSFYVNSEYGAFSKLSPVFGLISASFAVIAAVVLLATFLTGIGTVWMGAFGFQKRRRRLRRIADVHAALSANPGLPSLLLDGCLGRDRSRARWSRRILRSFGREMVKGLRSRWEHADAATRREIFSIVARRHDPSSMDFLETMARSLDWRARVRYAWAGLMFRMALWPKPLLVAVGIVLYIQLAALAVLYAGTLTNPAQLARTVSATNVTSEAQAEAISNLQLLAVQTESGAVADDARTNLTRLLTEPRFASHASELQLAVLRAVATIGRVEERQPIVDAVAKMLADPVLRAEAVTTLTAVGSVDAVRRLKAFIEQPLARRDAEDETKVREDAIRALAKIGGIDTFDALTALGQSEALGATLKKRVQEELASFDPLVQAESAITKGRYADAIALATRLLATQPTDQVKSLRARDLVTRAHTVQGSVAFNEERFDQAKTSLLSALDPKVAIGNESALTTLGLNLVYVYHEELAPKDPQAYHDVYEMLLKLQSVDATQENSWDIKANLAEASLTTHRYQEAEKLGRELISDQRLDPAKSLNMRFVVYAAMVLGSKPSVAARRDVLAYYQDLQKGFENDWSYEGTRSYIERADLSADRKTELLGVLKQVETPK